VIRYSFEWLQLLSLGGAEKHQPTASKGYSHLPTPTPINNTIDDYKLWKWRKKEFKSSPIAFTHAGSTVIDEKLYVVAGKNQKGHLRDLLIYDSSRDSWSYGPDLPSSYPAVEDPAATHHNGKMYVFGGQMESLSGAVNSAAKFDPKTGKWSTLEKMPTARGKLGAVVLGDLIYVVGGMSPTGHSLNTVEAYDTVTGKWETLADLTVPRDSAAVIAINGKIYVFGGRNRFVNDELNTVEVFDPSMKTWSLLSSTLPTPRRSLLVTSVNNDAILMGGESDHNLFSTNQFYDTSSNRWYTLPPLPYPVAAPSGGRIGNQVFLVGGDLTKSDSETNKLIVFHL